MSELINLIKKLKIKDYSIVNGKIEYSEGRYNTTNNSRVNLFAPFLVTSHPLKQEELPTAEDVYLSFELSFAEPHGTVLF